MLWFSLRFPQNRPKKGYPALALHSGQTIRVHLVVCWFPSIGLPLSLHPFAEHLHGISEDPGRAGRTKSTNWVWVLTTGTGPRKRVGLLLISL